MDRMNIWLWLLGFLLALAASLPSYLALGFDAKDKANNGNEKRQRGCTKPLYSYSENLCERQDVGTLEVEYAIKEIGSVSCGDEKHLKYFTAEKPFHIHYDEAREEKYYTLLMVDPDASSVDDPKYRYWLHWLVTNIDGDDLRDAESLGKKGTTLEYAPPSPPLNSGHHRYQFFLFEQSNEVNIPPPGNNRKCFSVVDFVEDYELGDPVAATQFTTHRE